MTAEELEEIEQYVAGGWERDPKPLAISKFKLACEKLLGEVRRLRAHPAIAAADVFQGSREMTPEEWAAFNKIVREQFK